MGCKFGNNEIKCELLSIYMYVLNEKNKPIVESHGIL